MAVHIVEEGRENFVIDLDRGTLMRLTADPGEDETPIWTPDGKWVVYTSTRADHARAIFRRMADGSSSEELLWSGTGHVSTPAIPPSSTDALATMFEQHALRTAAYGPSRRCRNVRSAGIHTPAIVHPRRSGRFPIRCPNRRPPARAHRPRQERH